jgi:serine/threonine protein kinase
MSAEGPVVLMEWVEGHTLSSSSSLFPVASGGRGTRGVLVAAVGAAVARILLEARRSAPHFVHRDISPRNIMVRGNEQDIRRQIASLDFDLSLIDMGSSSVPQEGNYSITMNSDIWRYGTPEYAAPEMLTKDVPGIAQLRNSPSIDVYALCSVLYELYAGYTPYDMENNQRRHGVSPYIMKMNYGPIKLSLHESNDRPLASMIMAGIMPKQSDRISLEELYGRCMAFLGRRDSASRVMRDAPVRPRQASVQISVKRPENGGATVSGPLPETLRQQMEESSRRNGRMRWLFG